MISVRPRGASRQLMLLVGLASLPSAQVAAGQTSETLTVDGLVQPAEILTDRWGVNHIYAKTQADLFFAQGYAAARDRLFQFELWRRQATGTVAEILGEAEVERDRGTRLFRFRGDITRELEHYHPDGVEIVTSFVRGVNAYIEATREDPDLLSIEFELLGIEPGFWTPEVVVSRHQGLLGNIGQELNYGRAVHALGPGPVRRLSYFHPVREGQPELTLDPAIDGSALSQDILAVYNAFRRPVRFRPEHILEATRRNDVPSEDPRSFERLAASRAAEWESLMTRDREDIGSNNWVVSGRLTQSGYPMMANDPHRAQAAPSLRYWAHLVGPGWDVIGGGEPTIPGISIGHNRFGAWGLTVFSTDGEDLYVYDTHPDDPHRYRYGDGWETMRVVKDTIPVLRSEPVIVDLKYTRHGPVVFEDASAGKAYAIRAAWMEIGGAPYLASLRMDQARTWEEFREACAYSNIPGENMVWAGRDGTIGWQAVGIAPIRRGWSGLVPVPGDGRYEWDGYLPITSKPHVVNPTEGYFGTANSNLTPPDYEHRDYAIGWTWSDPFRWARVNEALAGGRKLSLKDMMDLQTDYLSIPARTLVPLLEAVELEDGEAERARTLLLEWDHRLTAESVAAGIYVAWERRLQRNLWETMVPERGRPYLRSLSTKRMIDWLLSPPGELAGFGGARSDEDPLSGRNRLLAASFSEALSDLAEKLGTDMRRWQYGQPEYKHATIRHPLSAAVDERTRALLDVGPAPRGGYGLTVNNTGGGDNQTSGASFRIIVDTENWDIAVGSNTPGQSGDPTNPHYRDLFGLWAEDGFFPVPYTRAAVDAVAERTTVLRPG